MHVLLASTSTLYGGSYLDYLLPEIEQLFDAASEILFIPFARPGGITHEEYTSKVRNAFQSIGKSVRGLHEFEDMSAAVKNSSCFFTGGGNTFVLVSQLYRYGLMELLAPEIRAGKPYLGSSAGSNIAGVSMQTTNDMPIVYPPSFTTMGLVPFNLNPHYLDPQAQSVHMGETRETRIREFHAFNSTPVIGLREGSWMEVKNEQIELKGPLTARLFMPNQEPVELVPGVINEYI